MTNSQKKKNIIVSLLSAILIVIISKLNINWYFKTIMFPFLVITLSNSILVAKNKNLNKKAYLLLIPIILILICNIFLSLLNGQLDSNNKIINVFILPILISIYLFMLIDKNYKLTLQNIPLVFNLFPKNLGSNLKYIKLDNSNKKNEKIINSIIGIFIGIILSSVILALLSSADDYFGKFLYNVKSFTSSILDIGTITWIIIFFVILFSIGINILNFKQTDNKKNNKIEPNSTMITSMLATINLVFILFLISEISKLCGNFLKIPSGYIYSSYAREGFFQLLFVTIINFSIILFLLYKTDLINNNKIIKGLTLSLIIFSILLIFNSYYRMFLYIEKFGFTNLRLQVILFLLMELLSLLVILKKILFKLKNNFVIFFIIIITTYIVNLYICNNWFIRLFQ